MKPARRGAQIAYWIVPSLVCLLVFRRALSSWFRADDFAWLGLTSGVHDFHDLLGALFLPAAQGTFRPLSERAFFMLGFTFFGLDPIPFRIVIFGTQFANLALVTAIGARLTGRRSAGFCAALLWAVNSALILPLGWTSVYNQVMVAFFLLLAFYFLLRRIAAGEEGDARHARHFAILEWLVFLIGFGAQELNLVYPALAAVYTSLCARRQFSSTLLMFPVSVLYVVGHNRLAPVGTVGDYGMHFDASMLRVLGTYWTWSVGPMFQRTPLDIPGWVVPAGVALVSLALLGFLVWQLRTGKRMAVFFSAWFLIALAPVLPLRDHLTEYYVYIPVIGLCWLGGWGISLALEATRPAKIATVSLALLYGFLMVPRALDGSRWNHNLTIRIRDLVEGVAHAHELHPGKTILLEGVDSDQFWHGVLDHPYHAIGIDRVYLTPGSERRIDAHPDLGDIGEFVLSPNATAQGLARGDIVVYDVTGSELRNVTAAYSALPHAVALPRRVDAASPATAYLLGPEWFEAEGNHRWMPKRATLRLGGPTAAGQYLYLQGTVPAESKPTSIHVTVTVEGSTLPVATVTPHNGGFGVSFALPDEVVGKKEIEVGVEVDRTGRIPPDTRDLGLAFGIFEVR